MVPMKILYLKNFYLHILKFKVIKQGRADRKLTFIMTLLNYALKIILFHSVFTPPCEK